MTKEKSHHKALKEVASIGKNYWQYKFQAKEMKSKVEVLIHSFLHKIPCSTCQLVRGPN